MEAKEIPQLTEVEPTEEALVLVYTQSDGTGQTSLGKLTELFRGLLNLEPITAAEVGAMWD